MQHPAPAPSAPSQPKARSAGASRALHVRLNLPHFPSLLIILPAFDGSEYCTRLDSYIKSKDDFFVLPGLVWSNDSLSRALPLVQVYFYDGTTILLPLDHAAAKLIRFFLFSHISTTTKTWIRLRMLGVISPAQHSQQTSCFALQNIVSSTRSGFGYTIRRKTYSICLMRSALPRTSTINS